MRWLVADAVLVACAIVLAAAPLPQTAIERDYANGVYATLNLVFVPLSNAFPFALGDLELLLAVGVLIAGWVVGLRAADDRRTAALRLLAHTAGYLAAVVVVFYLVWGLNYRRASIVDRVDYDAARVTPAAVSALADRIAFILDHDVAAAHARARTETPSEMRAQLERDWAPVMVRLGDAWPVRTTVPKHTVFDRFYQMAGVGGQYDPFAFETLLISSFYPWEIPRALAHEWTHVAGFGNEGDANLVGTIACLRSPDPLIRYSGAYWTYGELPAADRARLKLSPAVLADFQAGQRRFLRYYSPQLFTISWGVYNQYLRANRVAGGVVSYSRFVELLVGTRFDAEGLPLRSRRFFGPHGGAATPS